MAKRGMSGWVIATVLLLAIVIAIHFFGAVVGDWLKTMHGGGGR